MWVPARPVMEACATVWLCSAVLLGCPQTVTPFPKEYVGVGVELAVQDGQAKVLRVIEGGPAAAAGITAGTAIIQIEAQKVTGMTLAQVVAALRGPADSTVTVMILRDGQANPVTLVRRGLRRADVDGGYVSGAKPR